MQSGIKVIILVLILTATSTLALPSSFHSHKHKRDDGDLATLSPSQDPFYTIPANIASIPRGQIIRSRKLPDLTSTLGPDAGDAYQLFYRTNGVNMQPDATVTTVVAPKKPVSGPPKIVAIGTPEDSAALDCSTSWAMIPNSKSSAATAGGVQPTSALAAAFLYHGYYVTIPDQEGSKSACLAYSEGQAMLDGILAIVNHKETIVDSQGYQAALTGYSGGGHASTWAAQLASTYGKGIPIVSLAAGGVPTNMELSLEANDANLGAGLVFATVAGYSSVYPLFDAYIKSILLQNGTEALEFVRRGTSCLSQLGTTLGKKSFAGSTIQKQPFRNKIVQNILDQNIIGKNQPPILDFPVYLIHSQLDLVAPIGPLLDYYKSQCNQGSRILLNEVPEGTHVELGLNTIPSLIYFVKQVFEDSIDIQGCNRTSTYLIPIDGQQVPDIIGPFISSQLQTMTVTKTVTGILSTLTFGLIHT